MKNIFFNRDDTKKNRKMVLSYFEKHIKKSKEKTRFFQSFTTYKFEVQTFSQVIVNIDNKTYLCG